MLLVDQQVRTDIRTVQKVGQLTSEGIGGVKMSEMEFINNCIIQAIDSEDWEIARYFVDILDELLQSASQLA